MAKPLTQPPSSSSFARLLDAQAAVRATAPVPEQPRPAEFHVPLTKPRPERPTIDRELLLTASADETLTRLVEMFRRATGTKLTTSHVGRAVLRGLAQCIDAMEREAFRIGRCRLPSNARGAEDQREWFEARIAEAIIAGVRAPPTLESSD